jgi:hypothetical protein
VLKDAKRAGELFVRSCNRHNLDACFSACLAGFSTCFQYDADVYESVRVLNAVHDGARRLETVTQSRSVPFLWLFVRHMSYDEVVSLPDYQILREAARKRLVEIARSDPDPRKRAAVVPDVYTGIPTNVLKEIAQKDPDPEVRKKAKERLAAEMGPLLSAEDAAELAGMAKSRDRDTRAVAVGRLEDVALLAEIAQKDPDSGIREDAVDRLADHADEAQAVLARIAEKDKDERVRSSAAALVTDPRVLERLLRTSNVASVRRHALENLEGKPVDPSLLLWVAEHDGDDDIRQEAASRITDQSVLARLATSSPSARVRTSATERLKDQRLLGEIAVRDSNDWVYRAAIMALTDDAVLIDVIHRRRDEYVLELVARNTSSQRALVAILQTSKESIPRAVAAGKLADRTLLAQLTKDPDPVVSNAATKRLKALSSQ